MRLGELLPKSRVGYLRWAPLSQSENILPAPAGDSNPGRWIYRQTLYHVAVKTGFYRKAVEVCYTPIPVTFSPTKLDFIPEVPGHRESFLMRLGELLPKSRVGYLRWAPLSQSENILPAPAGDSNPGCWIYRQTLYHVAVKAGFFSKAPDANCRRAKIFYLPQPGIEPRSLDLQANTLPRRCKNRLLPQGSRSVLYTYPRDILPHQIELHPRSSRL